MKYKITTLNEFGNRMTRHYESQVLAERDFNKLQDITRVWIVLWEGEKPVKYAEKINLKWKSVDIEETN